MGMLRTPVGEQLYVWTSSRTGDRKDSAIISAHGCTALINGMDTMRHPIKLHYYCPHGYSLEDPTIQKVIAGDVSEDMSGNMGQDYWLTKFQVEKSEKNADLETYESLYHLPETFEKKFKENPKFFAKYETMKMDVVTIRNRDFHISPRLSWVLKELWKNGYKYAHVHCSFCRPTFFRALTNTAPSFNPINGKKTEWKPF
jgi:hypothetical protein